MRQFLALALLSVATTAFAADKGDEAKKRTDQFVQLLLKVKQADEGKTLTAAEKAGNEKIFSELDGYFDWTYLTNEPVASRADKFAKDERPVFDKKFKEVIRLVAYPDSGSFFRTAKWKISGGKDEGGDKASSVIEASKEDLETKVELRWRVLDGSLRIYDVAFDGDSLVQDYKNQMVRIIDKGGTKELLAKIDKRKADLESGTPAKKEAPKK